MYIIDKKKDAKLKTVGTKAWYLFTLVKYFRVPEFAVVTTKGFKDYRGYKKLSSELESEIWKTLKEFIKRGPVALRSSCTAEDLVNISFAGMYVTVLNVKDVETGIRAIMRIWNSVDSPRVKKYQKSMSVPKGDMAVIVQHQLNPEISGVMVTQSPFSVNEILIECCIGLGEKLVSGKITPARYCVKEKDIIRHTGKNLLSDGQLLELVKTGKKIEEIFGSPQDIEWAIEDEKLYVLQSRPALVQALPPRKRGTVWCNANVRETIPDPISPMGYSFFEKILFPGIVLDTFGFPLTRQQYEQFRPVECVFGHLYWNVNNTAALGKSISPILELIEGDKSVDPQLAQALRSLDPKQIPKPIPTMRMLMFSCVAMVRLTYFLILSFFCYRRTAAKVVRVFLETEALSESLIPSHNFGAGVENIRSWLCSIIDKISRRYFGGITISVFYLVLLGKVLSLRIGKKGEALARMTTIGLIDKTGEMVLAVNALASSVHKKLNRLSLECLKKLYAEDLEFRSEFDTFIRKYGHRGPAEFDIASLNWREDYDLVYNLILNTSREVPLRNRKDAIKGLLHSLRPMERYIVKLFLPRIEILTPLRENGKHYILGVMAKIKDQLLILEEVLRRSKFLKHERDIFFLTFQDLEAIQNNRLQATETRRLVQARKKEWNKYYNMDVPDIVYENGEYEATKLDVSNVLSGTSVSYGKTKGRVRIIKRFDESSKLQKGEILVTHHTDPGWTPLFTIASGVIIEVGGVICHAAMVARELGVPAVVIRGATTLVKDGQIVALDADEGRVEIISNV